jgi:Flp pilus assembly pilin Flp
MKIKTLNKLGTLQSDERGQGLTEYALILCLASLAAVVGMNTIAQDVNNAFTGIGNIIGIYVP